MATKQEKINRLSAVSETIQPIPQVPKLPQFLRERHPDKIEEIEAYDKSLEDFFKKSGVIKGN